MSEKQLALAVLIYTEHCKPMAKVAIGDGGRPTEVITIRWDSEEERSRFHFNAYTLFCDKRMNASAIADFNQFLQKWVYSENWGGGLNAIIIKDRKLPDNCYMRSFRCRGVYT